MKTYAKTLLLGPLLNFLNKLFAINDARTFINLTARSEIETIKSACLFYLSFLGMFLVFVVGVAIFQISHVIAYAIGAILTDANAIKIAFSGIVLLLPIELRVFNLLMLAPMRNMQIYGKGLFSLSYHYMPLER